MSFGRRDTEVGRIPKCRVSRQNLRLTRHQFQSKAKCSSSHLRSVRGLLCNRPPIPHHPLLRNRKSARGDIATIRVPALPAISPCDIPLRNDGSPHIGLTPNSHRRDRRLRNRRPPRLGSCTRGCDTILRLLQTSQPADQSPV